MTTGGPHDRRRPAPPSATPTASPTSPPSAASGRPRRHPRRRTRRLALPGLSAAVAATLVALGGCSLAAPVADDPEDASTLEGLVAAWDTALAGTAPATRGALTQALRDLEPEVAEGRGTVRYVPVLGRDQDLEEDDPVALVVWEQRTGPDPFTDDVPRWESMCAQVHVDRSAASLVATQRRCPGSVPDEPPERPGGRMPEGIDASVVTEGSLLRGVATATGSSAAPLRRATSARSPGGAVDASPCLDGDLVAATDRLTVTIGARDEMVVRVVNVSAIPCTVPPPDDLRATQNGSTPTLDARTAPGPDVTLHPRESATTTLTWRPSQRVDRETPQRLVLGVGGLELPVHAGVGLPVAPLSAEVGARVDLSAWTVLGYGATPDDRPLAVDVAPRCEPKDLAVRTLPPADGSGSGAPPRAELRTVGVLPCRVDPAVRWPPLPDGLPPLLPGPPVVLTPGWAATVDLAAPLDERPGEVLVAGRWVAVRTGSG
ncbi:hypothetical protein KC207_04465 [Phycicoccus sp. BSK3Z-2]|uniref:DUF4232 domain-containing protein n=1 Tax=Phycicoccus avicenniae TaxID=2828860 RepID=A0A941D6U8_9MICO|nr:hypothetical protein [Phycicoccus avicenniae]MBR7742541.1 hypothetical protein [Phycicoccus avicenniae]